MATYHLSLLTSRDMRPCEKYHQLASVHVTCLRSNGLVRSTAALSLSVVLHHCDSVCADQLLWTGWILHITRYCYFKASVSSGMTAKPAENLSASGNKCPPESCPVQTPGRRSLALWPAFHPPHLLVTCASIPVIESLTQLFSHYVPSCLTSHPQGYIKICSLKESSKWDTVLPLIPPLHPRVHVKVVV